VWYPSAPADFLNSSHHTPPTEPEIASFHWDAAASSGPLGNSSGGEAFLVAWERALYDPAGSVQRAEALKASTGLKTKMLLNEFIPFVGDWCELTGNMTRCPNWQSPSSAGDDPDLQHAKGAGMNRRTWSWNAAGAVFALGFSTLAHYDYLAVGQDQCVQSTAPAIQGLLRGLPLLLTLPVCVRVFSCRLIGGTWPDNEPAVSSLDWQTGEPNAKYWVTNLLATTIGRPVEKSIMACNVTSNAPAPPPSQDTCLSDMQFGGGDVGVANVTVAAAVERCRMMPKCGGFTTSGADENCSASSARVFEMHFKDSRGVKNGRHVKGSTSWPLPPPPLPPSSAVPVHAMPYIMGGARGALLINKKAVRLEVRLEGVSGGVATMVEVDEASAEPGLAPPISRPVSAGGMLSLGPFGVAVVSELATS